MARKTFGTPLILGLITEAPDVTVTGGATVPGGSDPIQGAVSYEQWSTSEELRAGYDFDRDGNYTVAEYCVWWYDNGFDMDSYPELNPNNPWDESLLD